jgi:hypothetical protein
MTYSYVPGSCNLGKSEIRRRQFVALLGLFLTGSTLAGLIGTDAPSSARWGLFVPLMVFSVGFIQSRKKFCLAYGFMGTFNLGKLGDRKADRKTALKILIQSAALAFLLTVLLVAAPL